MAGFGWLKVVFVVLIGFGWFCVFICFVTIILPGSHHITNSIIRDIHKNISIQAETTL